MKPNEIYTGDCLSVLSSASNDSIDSIVTDPPYGLSFMNKGWDGELPDIKIWKECLRVAKPGTHLFAFGGTRTFHRLACHIEDAGWEIRDCLSWMYGTGFPKSLNIAKQKGCSKWEGWGTALKPAWEPIIMARKPLSGTVASNVQAFGTGGLNIDGCRTNPGDIVPGGGNGKACHGGRWASGETSGVRPIGLPHTKGRFPANVCLDEEAANMLDNQTGPKGGGFGISGGSSDGHGIYGKKFPRGNKSSVGYGDYGGPSRFFYCAKAPKKEREAGLDDLPEHDARGTVGRKPGSKGTGNPRAGAGRQGTRRNVHPTVKPIALMRWLVRLGTPPGGLVLDPFLGSGTTAVAAALEGFDFVGIELSPEYAEIARSRVAHWSPEPMAASGSL